MTHRSKLEKVLELLINEETDLASDLLHEIVVEKARDIYGSIVNESDDMDADDEEGKDEEVKEDFGGDVKDDYASEIGNDKEEIESDEIFNDAETADAGEEAGEEGEGEIEGDEAGEEVKSMDDLADVFRSEIDALKSELASLVGGTEAPADDMPAPMGSEEPADAGMELPVEQPKEAIGEATQLSKDVGSTGQDKEGKHAGTGKNSKDSAVGNKDSLKAPVRKDYGGKAVEFSKKSGDGKEASKSSQKSDVKTSNIDVQQKKDVKADATGDGKLVGTGKNSKTGSVNAKSILSKRPE